MSKSRIILKKGKYDSLERRHPWVFSGAVKEIIGSPVDGDVVDVYGSKSEFFGSGHFQNGSIMVRMLSLKKETIDEAFFTEKLQNALSFRLKLGLGFGADGAGNAWRLVFGEADSLPGLIVDYYNGVAVIQPHSEGFVRITELISECLQKVLGNHLIAVYHKPKDTGVQDDVSKDAAGLLYGSHPKELIITENGCKYYIDVIHGQKTGFFIDQRENRNMVSFYSAGCNVLNMFCYSGGFSVSALRGGASLVHSVDASASAIELARRNLELNGFDPQKNECIIADAFEYIDAHPNEYDLIILDPPAYAKHADARHRAVKGYQRLNLAALKVVKPGGLLFTFSCSQVVDKRLFESTVMSAAILSGRNVRVVQELSHAPCHAYSMTHPEGKYLKGLMLYVE